MTKEHSNYCHCVCTDLSDLQEAIEQARAIHYRKDASDKDCLVCGTKEENCDNCKFLKDCLVCGEEWPCDTFIALDYMA
jgi:hypothetical protein